MDTLAIGNAVSIQASHKPLLLTGLKCINRSSKFHSIKDHQSNIAIVLVSIQADKSSPNRSSQCNQKSKFDLLMTNPRYPTIKPELDVYPKALCYCLIITQQETGRNIRWSWTKSQKAMNLNAETSHSRNVPYIKRQERFK